MRKLIVLVMLGVASSAMAQSSSLYMQTQDTQAATVNQAYVPARQHRLNDAVAQSSYSAVQLPEPRRFAVHDLVTIIIRESTQTDFQANIETEKSSKFDGSISDFPRLNLRDLLDLQLRPSDMDEGPVKLGVDYSSEFEGEGDYSRRESVTGRITSRVIDVKPNGTLVLEARKFIQTDDETLDLVVTGQCRVEDVSIDNTILSTQLYDLRLNKQHTGELRKSTRKGIFTKVLEAVFNF